MSTRAINIATTAIASQSQRFSSISENIANLNTTGYKKSDIKFSEVVNGNSYDLDRAGHNGGGTPGFSTHSGILGGVQARNVRNYMEDSSFRRTNGTTDLAIKGPGQFIVREYSGDSLQNAGNSYLTTAGNFRLRPFYRNGIESLENQGIYLSDQNGYNVMGRIYDEETKTFSPATSISDLQPIRFERAVTSEAVPAIVTSRVTAAGNLSSDVADGTQVSFGMNIYTGEGKLDLKKEGADPHYIDTIPITVTFKKEAQNVWSFLLLNTNQVDGKNVEDLSENEIPNGRTNPVALLPTRAQQEAQGLRVQFSGDGKPLRAWTGGGTFPSATSTIYDDMSAVLQEITVTKEGPNSLIPDPDNPGELIPNPVAEPKFEKKDLEINFDFEEMTSYGGQTTLQVTPNGRPVTLREFREFSIESDGVVYRTFDDNSRIPLAKIVAGLPRSVSNVKSETGTLASLTGDSGEVSLLEFGSGSSQELLVGSLEDSNVDLAESFADMIVSQRAYSVNTKALTTAVQMQERALELKR